MNAEEKQALINWLEEGVACSDEYGFNGNILKSMQIALAALTAPAISLAELVPDSWQLVPIEPSWEMLSADGCKEHHNGQPCLHHDNRKRIWSAMLTAAPTPPE